MERQSPSDASVEGDPQEIPKGQVLGNILLEDLEVVCYMCRRGDVGGDEGGDGGIQPTRNRLHYQLIG